MKHYFLQAGLLKNETQKRKRRPNFPDVIVTVNIVNTYLGNMPKKIYACDQNQLMDQNNNRVSVWDDEKLLEVDSDDG